MSHRRQEYVDRPQSDTDEGEDPSKNKPLEPQTFSLRARIAKSVSVPSPYRDPSPSSRVHHPSGPLPSSSYGPRPPLSRGSSIRDSLAHSVRFFGVPTSGDAETREEVEKEQEDMWLSKRLKMVNRRYGLKSMEAKNECFKTNKAENLDGVVSTPGTERSMEMRLSTDPTGASADEAAYLRSLSMESRGIRGSRPHLERKDSVLSIMKQSLGSLLRKGSLALSPSRQPGYRSSFNPQQVDHDVVQGVLDGEIHSAGLDFSHPASVSSDVRGRSMSPPRIPMGLSRTADAKTKSSVLFRMGASTDSAQVQLAGFDCSGDVDVLQSIPRPTALHLTSSVISSPLHHDLSAVSEKSESTEDQESQPSQPFEQSRLSDSSRSRSTQPYRPFFMKGLPPPKQPTPMSLKSVCSLDDEVFFDVTPSSSTMPTPFPQSAALSASLRLDRVPEEPTPDYDTEVPSGIEPSGRQRPSTSDAREQERGRDVPDMPPVTLPFPSPGYARRVSPKFKFRAALPPQLQMPFAQRAHLELGDSGIFAKSAPVYLGDDPRRTMGTIGEPERFEIPPWSPLMEPRIRGLPRQDSVRSDTVDKYKRKEMNDRFLDDIYTKVKKSKQHVDRAARRGGEGVFGRLLHREMLPATELPAIVQAQMMMVTDERPFFTYWVTSVQVLITILSILFYGIGPFGFERHERRGEVLHTSVTLKMISVYEPTNFWLGPRFADLIRLGAKYSPCMRPERNVMRLIREERRQENNTGCCIYNDGSGCFQTTRDNCPDLIASYKSWPGRHNSRRLSNSVGGRLNRSIPFDELHFDSFYKGEIGVVSEALSSGNGRRAGPVCGQDPFICEVPPSIEPHEWPDDLTRWPVCRSIRQGVPLPEHMTCKLTGRPCCIQLQGQCRIATKEYCDFVQGYFHENATLCSQVQCLEDVCGMLPFLKKDDPDQFYRLFLSLFVHAGVFHCALSVLLQLWLMRDLEYMIGWFRMTILYLGSGIGGNLASAIFVPYNPEVGPAGSQLGIQAALLVDAYYNRKLIKRPWKAYVEHLVIVLLLFFLGIFPWVDNWAHLFGFIFGLFISLAIFPYMSFYDPNKDPNGYRKERTFRIGIVSVSILVVVIGYFVLGYVFFSNIDFSCQWCEYFNCLPFMSADEHFCDNQGLKLETLLPI